MRLILLLFTFAGITFTEQSRSCEELLGHKNCNLLPKDNECGAKNVRAVPNVVGGHDAHVGQFPWMAILNEEGHGRINVGCGGALINNNYVVTAAHCCEDKIVGRLWIRLGEHDLKTNPDCTPDGKCAPEPQDIRVESIKCHDFSFKTGANDICLLRLQRPANIHKYVSPICMPISKVFESKAFERYPVEVAGWGTFKQSKTQEDPNILQTVGLRVYPQEKCKAAWRNLKPVTDKQVCTKEGEGKGPCHGDSGGPLMSYFEDYGFSRYFLTGVVSFGGTKCGYGRPSVFTKVPEYNTWILDNMTR